MVTHKLASLFLAITAIGVFHMGEQLATGIEEFHMLREGIGGWWTLFPSALVDHASVMLITLIFLAVSLLLYALMRGGRAALVVLGLFGMLGISEAHHWIEAAGKGAYDPGLITSTFYVWIGALILIEVAREWRALQPAESVQS
jgi:hypothetical protein